MLWLGDLTTHKKTKERRTFTQTRRLALLRQSTIWIIYCVLETIHCFLKKKRRCIIAGLSERWYHPVKTRDTASKKIWDQPHDRRRAQPMRWLLPWRVYVTSQVSKGIWAQTVHVRIYQWKVCFLEPWRVSKPCFYGTLSEVLNSAWTNEDNAVLKIDIERATVIQLSDVPICVSLGGREEETSKEKEREPTFISRIFRSPLKLGLGRVDGAVIDVIL